MAASSKRPHVAGIPLLTLQLNSLSSLPVHSKDEMAIRLLGSAKRESLNAIAPITNILYVNLNNCTILTLTIRGKP